MSSRAQSGVRRGGRKGRRAALSSIGMRARQVALRFVMGAVRREWPMRLLHPAMGLYDPFVPAVRYDPYPTYRELRRRDPVHWHSVFRSHLLTRHADCVQVLRDATMSVERGAIGDLELLDLAPEAIEAIEVALLMVDPPDHTRLRGLVNKAFTPRVVERLRRAATEFFND